MSVTKYILKCNSDGDELEITVTRSLVTNYIAKCNNSLGAFFCERAEIVPRGTLCNAKCNKNKKGTCANGRITN